jgi:hypothetical protein
MNRAKLQVMTAICFALFAATCAQASDTGTQSTATTTTTQTSVFSALLASDCNILKCGGGH